MDEIKTAAAKQSHPYDMEEIASGGWSHPFQMD